MASWRYSRWAQRLLPAAPTAHNEHRTCRLPDDRARLKDHLGHHHTDRPDLRLQEHRGQGHHQDPHPHRQPHQEQDHLRLRLPGPSPLRPGRRLRGHPEGVVAVLLGQGRQPHEPGRKQERLPRWHHLHPRRRERADRQERLHHGLVLRSLTWPSCAAVAVPTSPLFLAHGPLCPFECPRDHSSSPLGRAAATQDPMYASDNVKLRGDFSVLSVCSPTGRLVVHYA